MLAAMSGSRVGACVLAGLLAALAAIACERPRDGFTREDRALFATLSPLPEAAACAPGSSCARVARLGQAIFFARAFSGPLEVGNDGLNGGLGEVGEVGKVGCVDCHDPDHWFVDRRSRPGALSLGAGWTERNAPTLVDVGYQTILSWSGQYDSLAQSFEVALTRENVLHSSAAALVAWLGDPAGGLPFYQEAFGAPPGADAFDRAAEAISLYLQQLVSGDAPFDRFVAGDDAALSEPQKRGLQLFIGDAGCIECHHGPLFSDGERHATGVPQEHEDPGFGHGEFRTASLRSVAETAPYTHAGQLATLTDVVELYNQGGSGSATLVPLGLDDGQVADLVAFLESLTGKEVEPRWREDPFAP
jgi:cytochrome c peroxidase